MPRCPSCQQEVPVGRYCLACGVALVASSDLPTRLQSRRETPPPVLVSHGRFLPGMLLAGRYRIVAPLGRGGMGEVYRADDMKLGQGVALKFLPEGLDRDEVRLARFLGEVRTARQVAHPNVCRVYDIGEVEGHHFISMEYVDGEDLGSLLRRIGRLPSDKGIQIARQVSAGLAAAHDAGVLHRDLKPANIMIDGRGRARITDFGLATAAGEIPEGEARSGTPAYMAPEQLGGKEVTHRSDLYALGLVLYELFTGRPPFKASTAPDLLRQQTTSSPASPSSVVDGLDPAVERIILHCLEPDPARRPSSAMAVASALPGGDPLAAALAAGETPSPELVAAAGESDRPDRRLAMAALAGIGAGLVLLVNLSGKTQAARLVPLDKPPEVLSEKAREILRAVDPAGRPADSLAAFKFNGGYLEHLIKSADRVDWPGALGRSQPSAIRFGYRESPRPLDRLHNGGIGDWFDDPPPTSPGMAEVTLDLQGRLVGLIRVPHSRSAGPEPGPEPDWRPLLLAAGFPPAGMSPVSPRLTPPIYADRRAAWEGAYPGPPEIPVRIEAAALGGQPVALRVVEPWDHEPETGPRDAPPGVRLGAVIRDSVFLLILVAAGVVAFRNLRLGRGDRRGALRFAIYLATMRVLWLLSAHHLPIDREVGLLLAHGAWAMYRVGMVALLYLALEPYARRQWPRMLVSWMRLLDGRLRDPLVGRDALFGVLMGVAIAVSAQLTTLLSWRTPLASPPPDANLWTLESLRGLRHALGALIGIHTQSVITMFVPLMLLIALRLALRKTWIAVAVTSVAGILAFYPGSGSFLLHAATFFIPLCLFWLTLFRFGLFGLLVASTLAGMFQLLPLTFDLSAWFGAPSLLILLLVAGLSLFAFRAAHSGRPPLRAGTLAEEPAR